MNLLRFFAVVLLALLLPATPARAVSTPPTVVDAVFDSAATVPITAASYTAAGNTVNLTLGFAPPTGASLTVVNNTGTGFITGVFDNLAQGQRVNLTFGGISYPFVANYFGGTCNNLVLQWANLRMLGWGENGSGQLGNGSTTNSTTGVAVDMTGLLAGKSITAMAAGGAHTLALCADGTLAAWGSNSNGQLGNSTAGSSAPVPVLVDRSGVLAGKTVVAIAAGFAHNLALCSDGTLAAWGYNVYGQVGGGSGTTIATPVPVSRAGVLAGKVVTAIAAGYYHSLALCADGTLAAWGGNDYGQLGNGNTSFSTSPVAVDRAGVLAGKTVTGIGAGSHHCFALCSDGTVTAWGSNSPGSLGNNTTTNSNVPVLVDRSGILSGKTVAAISAGGSFGLALCSNGTVAAWGENSSSQLGNGGGGNSKVPVWVTSTGVLSGKSVTAIDAGGSHSLGLCADGALVAWGYNYSGQLGNGSTTSSSVPVWVGTSALNAGERFVSIHSGSDTSFALVASPPPPQATTLAATGILDTGATLNGSVNAQGLSTTVAFEYGLTTLYGAKVAAVPASASGLADTAVSAAVGGLLAGATYHYRTVATSAGGTVKGADMTFTTTGFASLSDLTVSSATLSPAFAPSQSTYLATLPAATATIRVTPVTAYPDATVKVNGTTVVSGTPSDPLNLAVGNNTLSIVVTSADGLNLRTYAVTVTRLPEMFAFASAATVPVTVGDFFANGNLPPLVLTYAPTPGTVLTVVKNTGMNPIRGAFADLTHGQTVTLIYNGISYPFVVNYYGGSGNDLVLQWANVRLFGWGSNGNGQLGLNNGSYNNVLLPTQIDHTGVLAGKTILSMASGGAFSMALCSDGTFAAWGDNAYGQLGNNSPNSSTAPVLVDRSGVLSGKTVVAVAAGTNHALALCSDGTLAAWGENSYGSLGINSTTNSRVPILVDRSGVLAGKTVVAVAAGESYSLVLCADGTLAAWGRNDAGQLANGGTTNAKVPGLVNQTGVLAGKTVTAISSYTLGSMALCAGGAMATWGHIPLGTSLTRDAKLPGLVDQTGVLAGKTVVAMAAGSPCVALCQDGTFAVWGGYFSGTGATNGGAVPALVSRTGPLAGKSVTSFSTSSAVLVGCSDGTAAAWGSNGSGQLGKNATSYGEAAPVAVLATNLPAGARFMTVFDGAGYSSYSFAVVALPAPPTAATLAASAVNDAGAALNASVEPNGSATAVSFEYGLTTAYGTTVAAVPASVSGSGTKPVSFTLGGLPPGTTYHYRVVASNPAGTIRGDDQAFTTTTFASLGGLALGEGSFTPAFDPTRSAYIATVPYATAAVTVTPVTVHVPATVKVAGVAVASGTASTPVPVAVGNTTIAVVVTSGDGLNTRTYQIVVTRMPETLPFPNASSVPITAVNFAASGNAPEFSLGHAPVVGAALTVVTNTGSGPIQGAFGNLVQGQRVALAYGGITYPFIVNYAGGTGNDLVLEWGNTRLMAWGWNEHGQLGTGTLTNATIPAAMPWTGELAGKTVRELRAGYRHTLALTWDGSVVFAGNPNWGSTATVSGNFAKIIPAAGALTGKTVVAIAAGEYHNLALCTDGTVAAWGDNYRGQLGNDGSSNLTTNTPVAVVGTGALAGKEIVGIEAGNSSSVALCADGTVVQWGWLSGSQMGENSRVPVSMQNRGALVGKKVVKLRAGFNNWLALGTDGTLVAWGANNAGQFGNGTSVSEYTDDRYAPVAVTMTGVLAGKTIKEMAVGYATCLVLCTDGTLVSWGSNSAGQLGIGTTTNSNVPVRVTQTGVLAGKTVVKVFAGSTQCYALCSDGSMAAWGSNTYGNLGNGTTTASTLPVLVSKTNFTTGERFAWSGGSVSAYNHALALSALPPAPVATTLAADGVTDNTATLRAAVQPNGSATPVTFEYGRTSDYGVTVAATSATVSGGGATAVAANLTNLPPGTTYHFRVIAAGPGGTARGEDMTFTTGTLATLGGLTANVGSLQPDFDPLRTRYSLTVSATTTAVALTPVAAHSGAAITVNGVAVNSGSASTAVPVGAGNTVIPVGVTAADASTSTTYSVTVTQVPEVFEFRSAGGAALTAEEFDGSGLVPMFTLAFVPVAGTDLRVVNQTGLRFFRGRFDNLAQGQEIDLFFNGIGYRFVADYFGGTGNDLVLRWANARLAATGSNSNGQIGDISVTSRSLPTAVVSTGVLAGKTVIATAAGYTHTVALCADGTLAAWGANASDQLGTGDKASSTVPVAVQMTGDLAGRRVVAVAAGYAHTLVLCDDGAILGWGSNSSGQLGNTGRNFHTTAVLLEDLGALAGREVVAIAAGQYCNLALCADGTVAAWGNNGDGQLGDGTTVTSRRPVAVSRTGALADKAVVMIAAGLNHNLALCADGALVAWGANLDGQLGTGDALARLGPVAVKPVGALAGKTVAEIAVGNGFNLVRCTDNTLVAWGGNSNGQLGNGTTTSSLVPVAVTATGALAGKTITRLALGGQYCIVQCADVSLVGWGANASGCLGTGTTTNALLPVAMSTTGLAAGERLAAGWTNCLAGHTLALVASPPRAGTDTLAATAVTDNGVTLNGLVRPNGSATTVTFEYGLTETYGSVAAAVPSPVAGGETAVAATLANLTPGSVYHFRVKAVNAGGTATGVDRTFATTQVAGLAGLSLDAVAISPVFESRTTGYLATVPNAVASVTLTPQALDAAAVIEVAGAVVASGAASTPIPLAVGTTPVAVRVVSGEGVSTQTYTVNVTRLPETIVFHSAGEIPVSAAGMVAGGNSVSLALEFAPPTGTTLTVVNNTGSGQLDGSFANLAQGQAVTLDFGGVSYPFVADYSGGTGNDLVLRWGNSRVLELWNPLYGQAATTRVLTSGALADKTAIALADGYGHVLALCADGTVAAWGTNDSGELGINSTAASSVPVAVDATGVLAGKRVVQIAVSPTHNLVLCSDGTLAAWGSNEYGKLGLPPATTTSPVPVEVNRTGALAGKTVTGIGVGESNSYAICADGTVAAWGANGFGQLGNGGPAGSYSVPVAVDASGVLAGKRVVSIDGGYNFCIALCADGTVAAWGYNASGQLGNNTRTDSAVPVAVVRSGVLAGKTVAAISAGTHHTLARCADGTLASWGYNGSGQLGNPVSNSSAVPVLMNTTGVLAGKSVVAISAGAIQSLGLCADGFLAVWGATPTTVDISLLQPGERLVAITCGASYLHGIVVSPPKPVAATLAATSVTDTAVTLRGRAGANGGNATVAFEYGLTAAYGTTTAATPASLTGTVPTDVSSPVTGLLPGTTYHYRVVAQNAGGVVRGQDLTFTTGSEASLTGLAVSAGSLMPAFASTITDYSLAVPFATDQLTVTPATFRAGAAVTVNGAAVAAGTASAPIALAVGNTPVSIAVDAGDGINTRTYQATVTRLPEALAFDSAASVPVTVSSFAATGLTTTFALRYAPQPGAVLTVVNNTGADPIQGTFANLTQGQRVELVFNGITYPFNANYFGGTGNDLVLQWAGTRLVAWGYNNYGQLGNGGSSTSLVPTPVDRSGGLAGKTIMSTACGSGHSLAVTAEGGAFAWGYNSMGQLGDNSTTSKSFPLAVSTSGVLAGKTVISIAAGFENSLAVWGDGTLVAWGSDQNGQLGSDGPSFTTVPMPVDQTGVLAGKTVTAVASGYGHCLALCSDGSVAAWGTLTFLGTGMAGSTRPVLVDASGVLAGKRVVAIAAGMRHNLVLCADGTLAAWGENQYGQVGDNSSATSRPTPVLVNTSGILAGKKVVAISAGEYHSLALCADGTLVAWGYNNNGQLGDATTTTRLAPVAVSTAGVLAGKTVTAIMTESYSSFALCADGTLAAWGGNSSGQLGNNTTTNSNVPVAVSMAGMAAGERFMVVTGGSRASHCLATVATAPPPTAVTAAASVTGAATSVTLNGRVSANGSDTTIAFEYGLTTAYGNLIAATPAQVSGNAVVDASAAVSGLLSGAGYHYRIIATSAAGVVKGEDRMVTTQPDAALSRLALGAGMLEPAFQPTRLSYLTTVPFAVTSITVNPVTVAADATVTVNGIAVAAGGASAPLDLTVGNQPLNIAVTAADGVTTQTYTVTFTRLPAVFAFNSATDVPVTANGFAATGLTADAALNFAPQPGTRLTLVGNSGDTLIAGRFANLAQDQLVELTFAGQTYRFMANYRGGNGNDLTLEWAAGRVLRWGSGTTMPTALDTQGILHGGRVVQVAASSGHRLVLMADGSLYGMGSGSNGRLGNGSTSEVRTPMRLNGFGALAGRAVVAVAAGEAHGLALCADGTLTAWGSNGNGQLGTGDNNSPTLPVEVDRSGVLAGRRIVALAASSYSSFALCEDGAIAAWGTAYLGNGSTSESRRPVLVDASGVLAGKRVVSLAVGTYHVVALCDDGFLAAWGANSSGSLGNGSTTLATVPVAVDRSGVLAGKTVVSVASAGLHNLVLCSDGSLAAWGAAPTGPSNVPVIVNPVGALAGKTVTGIAAGDSHCMALCADGTVAAWGSNTYGQLGNGTTTSSTTPVAVSMANLVPGERVTALVSSPFGSTSAVHALTALPDWLEAVTLPASPVAGRTATVRGGIETGGMAVSVFFDYGPTTDYGLTSAAEPASLTAGAATVEAVLTGLAPATTYHYRVRCTSPLGTILGEDLQFTTATVATLVELRLSQGTLGPAFAAAVTRYAANVPATADAIALTPVAANPGAMIEANGSPVVSDSASAAMPLAAGANTVVVKVTSPDGSEVLEYTVVVNRLPAAFEFAAVSDVPVIAESFTATGLTATFGLHFAPPTGTQLTVVRITGNDLIDGTFANLAQGQMVALEYGGTTYQFVANYFGGDGNDLVLEWANTHWLGWGYNTDMAYGGGALANGTTSSESRPVLAANTGVLVGKRILKVAAGGAH